MEEVKITPDKAEGLARAIRTLKKEFPTVSVDPKTGAILGLGFTALSIYGPMAVAVAGRYQINKAKRQRQAREEALAAAGHNTGNVHPIRPDVQPVQPAAPRPVVLTPRPAPTVSPTAQTKLQPVKEGEQQLTVPAISPEATALFESFANGTPPPVDTNGSTP